MVFHKICSSSGGSTLIYGNLCRITRRFWVAFISLQPFERLAVIQIPEQVVKGSVFKHQDDDVLDWRTHSLHCIIELIIGKFAQLLKIPHDQSVGKPPQDVIAVINYKYILDGRPGIDLSHDLFQDIRSLALDKQGDGIFFRFNKLFET